MTDNRLLDIRVAKEIMGQEVVGYACAIFVEGSWSVHPDSEPEGWACHASVEPVMPGSYCRCAEDTEPQLLRLGADPNEDPEVTQARETYAKEMVAEWHSDRERFQGHDRHCVEVVPFYSTEIAEAMKVVNKLHEDRSFGVHAFSLRTMHEGIRGWFATFVRASSPVHSNSVPYTAEGASAEESICLAALKVYPKWT